MQGILSNDECVVWSVVDCTLASHYDKTALLLFASLDKMDPSGLIFDKTVPSDGHASQPAVGDAGTSRSFFLVCRRAAMSAIPCLVRGDAHSSL